jgi:argininosuccinate synthase
VSAKGGTYEDVNKIVLAYSGGLDTSVILKMLQDVCQAEVVSLTLDIGQQVDLKAAAEKAKALGALKHYSVEAKKEFADGYITKAIKANSLYQGEYPNSTTIGRPLIAKYLVEIARKEKADAVAHGCTGKGNDQVRFDISVLSLDPELEIIAPVRDWGLMRDKEMEYAQKHGIPVPVTKKSPYSVDENMWGRSSECGILEYPHEEAPDDVFHWCTLPEKAPDKAEKVKIHFEQGIPVKFGDCTEMAEIVQELNEVAGKHGVGIIDHMEDRTVGLKSREVYECPAATVLLKAHKDLEKYVLTREENEFKPVVDKLWSEMAYKGLWYSPLMGSLNAFMDKSQEFVDGWVKLKLYKGSSMVIARHSDNALYDHNLATYDEGSSFDQSHAKGFIQLWGLNTVSAMKVRKK